MNRAKYGVELIIDLHDCDTDKFKEESLKEYIIETCRIADMKTHGEPHFWFDDSGQEHLNGTSVLQFIETSNIVVHALNLLNAVYINFFSCKEFDTEKVTDFTVSFFKAREFDAKTIDRI